MTIDELVGMADALDSALDELVDEWGRWRDVPFAYFSPDAGWGDRFEMVCSCCGARFWPIWWSDAVVCGYREWEYSPFYYQAGYWFGNLGQGHHFPICSTSCHDALKRQLEKRMLHTKGQMEQIARARRLIKECRATIKRSRAE